MADLACGRNDRRPTGVCLVTADQCPCSPQTKENSMKT